MVGEIERPLQKGDRVGLELDLIVGVLKVHLNGILQQAIISTRLPCLDTHQSVLDPRTAYDSSQQLFAAWCLNNEDEQFMLVSATTLSCIAN